MARNQRMGIAEVRSTGPDQVLVIYTDGQEVSMAAHVWNMRCLMIKQGMEWEIRIPGGKLTAKAPSCFTIARQEFGIHGRDKVKAYKDYCKLVGLVPKREIVGDDAPVETPKVEEAPKADGLPF